MPVGVIAMVVRVCVCAFGGRASGEILVDAKRLGMMVMRKRHRDLHADADH